MAVPRIPWAVIFFNSLRLLSLKAASVTWVLHQQRLGAFFLTFYTGKWVGAAKRHLSFIFSACFKSKPLPVLRASCDCLTHTLQPGFQICPLSITSTEYLSLNQEALCQDVTLPQLTEVWWIKGCLVWWWPVMLGKSLSYQISTRGLRLAGGVLFLP